MSSLVRIPRVYTDASIAVGETLVLPKRSSHHLIKVLRLDIGANIELFNGDGFNYQATVSGAGKTARADIHAAAPNECESPLTTRVIQGVSRGDKMDTSIQKSVELGVNEIVPVYTQHSIKPLTGDRSRRKQEHWQQIAVAASEQSGRSVVPKVLNAMPLQEFLQLEQQPSTGINNVQSDRNPLKLVLDPQATMRFSNSNQPASAWLLIGPEIGFSDEEIRASVQAGFAAINLGTRVLRTETAAPVALAVLQTLYGDFCCQNLNPDAL